MLMENNLKRLRDSKDWTLEYVANLAGTTNQHLSRLENKKSRLNVDWLEIFAKIYGVAPSDILSDENKKSIKSDLQPKIAGSIDEISYGPEKIPVYGHIKNAEGVLVLNIAKPVEYTPSHPNQQDVIHKYAAYPPDNTMSPRYELSDKAFWNQNQNPAPMQDCWVELNNGEFHLKKYVEMTAKEIICRQLNPSKEWKRPRSEVKAVHAVVGRG